MKTIKILTGYLIIMCLGACKSMVKEQTELDEIFVDISNTHEFYDLSTDIEPEIDIVILDTDDQCMIADIKKILYANDMYYILDDVTASVFMFDKNGKFLNKLAKLGRAPNEYLSVTSFTVIGDNIWISDNTGDMVKCYDSNCEYVTGFPFPQTSIEIESLNDYIFISTNSVGYSDANYQLYRYDTREQNMTFHFPFPAKDPNTIIFSKNTQFAKQSNSCLFIYPYNDVIYEINSDVTEPRYRFVFSERYEDKPILYSEFNPQEAGNIIRGLTGIMQTPNSIILEYSDRLRPKCAIFNKETNKCVAYEESMKISAIGGLRIGNYFIQESEIFAYYPVMYLTAPGFFEAEKIENPDIKQMFNNIIDGIDENDNPIIVRFKLKHNSAI